MVDVLPKRAECERRQKADLPTRKTRLAQGRERVTIWDGENREQWEIAAGI